MIKEHILDYHVLPVADVNMIRNLGGKYHCQTNVGLVLTLQDYLSNIYLKPSSKRLERTFIITFSSVYKDFSYTEIAAPSFYNSLVLIWKF